MQVLILKKRFLVQKSQVGVRNKLLLLHYKLINLWLEIRFFPIFFSGLKYHYVSRKLK
jgi:hypothetical protein